MGNIKKLFIPTPLNEREDLEASATSPLLPAAAALSAPPPRAKNNYIRPFLLLCGTAAAGVLVGGFCKGSVSGGRRGEGDGGAWPTFVGFEGPTPTGSEALAAATAYPSNSDYYPLRPPSSFPAAANSSTFDVLDNLGNLSPWRSVNHGLAGTGQVPKGCTVEQVHLLHRHGARYPTTGAGPAVLAKRLASAKNLKATGDLSFLNSWAYQLGAEILTPFGREQLFALGTAFRVKYGRLLNPAQKPVFRTESQDRMLKSALNFAAGFFGIPYEDQYHQLITIEWAGQNNTLAPYMTCPNGYRANLNLGREKVSEWLAVYLTPAVERLQKLVTGFELTLTDVYHMQEMGAYELVSLGGSEFLHLFTEQEWEGFEYSLDLGFWYGYSYGHPAQAAIGLGWVQEWLARVTKTPLAVFNSSTNASYHTPEYFPLEGQNIFVDATHDTVISAVITTLNFASFAASGPPPSTHIPASRSFIASKISPFAANLQAHILSCPERSEKKMVRWVLNDGVVPLEAVEGCERDEDGLCELDRFVLATRERAAGIDWEYDCYAPYSLGDEPIVDGRPPRR